MVSQIAPPPKPGSKLAVLALGEETAPFEGEPSGRTIQFKFLFEMITEFELSQHARDRMRDWQVTEEMVIATLLRPEGRVWDKEGEYFYQRIVLWHTGKKHLLRVLVDETQMPPKVITMYHSSRYGRYTR